MLDGKDMAKRLEKIKPEYNRWMAEYLVNFYQTHGLPVEDHLKILVDKTKEDPGLADMLVLNFLLEKYVAVR